MKFDVPLMMPAIHSMRLAVRPFAQRLDDRHAAGDRRLERDHHALARDAAAKISLPCCASSALLAVTTCLPCAIASSTSVRAGSMPPISSHDDVDVGMRDDDRRVVGEVDAGDAARAVARAVERARRDPR